MRRLFEWWFGQRADKGFDKVAREKSLGGVVAISEWELAEMFLHVPYPPGWKATLTVLDLQVQEGLERCLDEMLTNEQLRFRLGCVAACPPKCFPDCRGAPGERGWRRRRLLEFKGVLQEREREARKQDAVG